LTGTDDAVYRRFMRVLNLLDPPSSLFHPSVVGKVAIAALRGPRLVRERPLASSAADAMPCAPGADVGAPV
jgi:hypothetical protein